VAVMMIVPAVQMNVNYRKVLNVRL